jgi:rod shape-determining protein MreC
MPLGTLDRSPPPFFRQGPSALTRLVFFASLAVFLMAADTRLQLAAPLRTAVAIGLQPMQRALLAPVTAWHTAGDYLDGIGAARQQATVAETRLAAQADRTLRLDQLAAENVSLRALLALRERLALHSHAAEVLYDAADPYSRKIVIDRGEHAGVLRGSPVVNADGVIGQVTRVYPLTAEVTLLTDRDAAIPVLNGRTQQRHVAFGDPGGAGMELRFVAANADVQVGDIVSTSGLDGVYPPGLPVARVTSLERRTQTDFARIVLQTTAPTDGVRQVLVLDPLATQLPPRPTEETASTPKRGGADNLPARKAGARR